jgi:hypothetical protein
MNFLTMNFSICRFSQSDCVNFGIEQAIEVQPTRTGDELKCIRDARLHLILFWHLLVGGKSTSH